MLMKTKLGKKCWLTFPDLSLLLREVRAGNPVGTEARTVEENSLLPFFLCLVQLALKYSQGQPADEWHYPHWIGSSYINHKSKRCMRDVPKGQYD